LRFLYFKSKASLDTASTVNSPKFVFTNCGLPSGFNSVRYIYFAVVASASISLIEYLSTDIVRLATPSQYKIILLIYSKSLVFYATKSITPVSRVVGLSPSSLTRCYGATIGIPAYCKTVSIYYGLKSTFLNFELYYSANIYNYRKNSACSSSNLPL
jgi:hypothetical protein